ncbi:MAG: oligosaccharide flippase family protein [Bacteroidales bacterium]|nr:oligosaccharide flippase family protein [Bacteroidales bacterium]
MKRALRDGAALLSGQLWAQVIAFVGYLLLTRLYSPEAFGIYAIFCSYLEILIILSTCKYEMATVVAPTDEEAATVSRLAMRLNAGVSTLLLLIIGVLWWADCLPGQTRTLGALALFIPPMVFFTGGGRVYSMLANRYRRFQLMASVEAGEATAGLVAKLAATLLRVRHAWADVGGMPVGAVVGRMVSWLAYRVLCRKHLSRVPIKGGQLRTVARTYRNFPLYSMPKEFVAGLSMNLPFLWVALYFDRAEVGLLSLALTFTLRPVGIVNTVAERMLYVRMAERVRCRQHVWPMLRRFLLALMGCALPLFVVGYCFAEPLFSFFFGGRWAGCAPYVRAVLPWLYLLVGSGSLLFVSSVFATQKQEFILFCMQLLLRAAGLWVGVRAGSFLLAVQGFAVGSGLMAVVLGGWYVAQVLRYEHSLSSTDASTA